MPSRNSQDRRRTPSSVSFFSHFQGLCTPTGTNAFASSTLRPKLGSQRDASVAKCTASYADGSGAPIAVSTAAKYSSSRSFWARQASDFPSALTQGFGHAWMASSIQRRCRRLKPPLPICGHVLRGKSPSAPSQFLDACRMRQCPSGHGAPT